MDWEKVIENNFVLLAALILWLSGLGKRVLNKMLHAKKAEAGSLKLEFDGSDEAVAATLKTVWGKFDGLKEGVEEIKAIAGGLRGEMNGLREEMNGLQKAVDGTSQKQEEMYADQLKLLFYNNGLSDEERLAAGMRYVKKGYNHQAKSDIIYFGLEHEGIYRGITVGGKSLAIPEIEDLIARRKMREGADEEKKP